MLQGAGVITEIDASSVIDKNKIYRARKKRRINSVALNKTALNLQSLYFDGRKDQTITQKLINGRMHERTAVEKHITLIKEPQSEYIGHFAASIPVQANFDLMCLILYFVFQVLFIPCYLFVWACLTSNDTVSWCNYPK